MNYEQDAYIDETALDVEWLEQAELAIKYGKHWAMCKKKYTHAEEKIKLVRADLVKQANEDPDKHLGDGVKPTAVNVESYYRSHPDHKKAKQEWIELGYELNVAEVARNEISYARKSALENLVRLHAQQYFAGPSVPRKLEQERQAVQRTRNKKMGNSLKRNK